MCRLVRSSGLLRAVYRPEMSAKWGLFPRFRHREIGAYHRVLIVVRPRKGGVGTHDAIAERLPAGEGGADGRDAARGALVEADREVQLLRLGPERVVVRRSEERRVG